MQHGRLLIRLDALERTLAEVGIVPAPPAAPHESTAVGGLSLGTQAPTFSATDLSGGTVTLDMLTGAGKPVILIFSDPGCGPCAALLPEISRWQRSHHNELTITLISRGEPNHNRSRYAPQQLRHVLLQADKKIADAYHAAGTPSAVVVTPDGTIGSGLAVGAAAIRALVVQTLSPQVPTSATNGNGHSVAATLNTGTAVGASAPVFALPNLQGDMIRSGDLEGRNTLLLFWNPSCGFCQQMLDQLKQWEKAPPSESPRLVLISTGDFEANRHMGLRSLIALDQDFSVGRAFGANGTPSAVLVDAQGRVGSRVVVGAAAVWELLARGSHQQLTRRGG